ncbi:L-idonate 5-dehydrogenase [Kushneria phosphatilytica]|uniref:L-idonate 5-dehydrogenase n=1 Tax=Kushneria phosphatilytica TaxID=657387 RepID=A0A1S1NW64_9GAMM|nr:L-idonate 5-dehydrogenase [Kushneria phosphatilytica]OHV08411.1 L-idonate 5-dehydrogenase [Kushneria phosphatilytica]QEL09837.1 L-idonate 5-dehydrogenase [Kushneria phosphatilytica]
MKALFIHGKQDLRESNVETPEPGEGQVRLRMAFGGICGSDLHYYHEGANGAFVVREPLIPGHEMSGVVDHDPSGRLAPGTPVTLHPATFGDSQPGIEAMPHLWPNGAYLGSASTWPHTQGGMSEYLIVDAGMIRQLPEGLSLKRAALAEPLAVGLHGINIAGGVEGKRVLVCGSGPIGLLAAAAALAKGAAEVTATDVLEGPLERARELGVTRTLQIGVDELPAEAFDVVLECSGVPASIDGAITAVRRAGVIAQIGMMGAGPQPVSLAALISKEVQLRGCFRFNQEIDEAIELLATDERFDRVITHVLPATDAEAAFAAAKDSQASGKVLVELWPAEGQR